MSGVGVIIADSVFVVLATLAFYLAVLRPDTRRINRGRAPACHRGQPPTRYVNTRTGEHRWRPYGRSRPRPGNGWVCDDGDTCRLDPGYDPYPKQALYLDERSAIRSNGENRSVGHE
ncbi:MAG: hypothetical protein ACRDQA_26660 [Nocardioidaceae bacterium]